jgi:hypothetical protein
MNKIKDADYELVDNAGWFKVKGFAVRIAATDYGVSVDIYQDGNEWEPLASAEANDDDLIPLTTPHQTQGTIMNQRTERIAELEAILLPDGDYGDSGENLRSTFNRDPEQAALWAELDALLQEQAKY